MTGLLAGQLGPDLDPDTAASLLIGSLYARYLRTTRIPDDWAERALSVIWPPASTAGDDVRLPAPWPRR